ncbi:unnamed protein product [Rhizoctonia solani]|uniref:BTB domain-containing protein n=1 Tax=Rhizoctonia solani TaxID=456999 RepID=A0A8H3DZA8_9AGAM|nr:unnamed protein product [Rhizoctonia solani]
MSVAKVLAMEKRNSPTLTSEAGYWVFVDGTSVTRADSSPKEIPSALASGTPERHPKFCFDDTLIAIQIENTLFNVHKYQLAKSEIFSDMFKMPRPEGNGPEEGSSLEHPISLKGVSASDFAALMTVLYASHFSDDQPAPQASLIIPAFRLANMFNFSELRAYLLPLAEKHLDGVDKIMFAREFDIKEWLALAHVRLCQREQPLNAEEAEKLGVQSVLLISNMREQQRTLPSTSPMVAGNYYCHDCTGMTSYTGSNATCNGCQSYPVRAVYYGRPGTMTQIPTTTSSTAIEAIVKKWVEDGCTLKD